MSTKQKKQTPQSRSISPQSIDGAQVEIKIKHPEAGKVTRTITNHNDMTELIEAMQNFVKEANDVIQAGEKLSVTCAGCCNKCSWAECFTMRNNAEVKTEVKTDVQTDDVKLSVV